MRDEAAELVVLLAVADGLVRAARIRPIDRDRALVLNAQTRLTAQFRTMLAMLKSRLAVRKAAGDEDDLKLDPAPIADVLEQVAVDGAQLGMKQVGASDLDVLLSQANANAQAWADQHAGELVQQVRETTRQAVADLTAQALAEGWSNDQLADALDSSGAFGAARAERIARTESAMADIQGNLIGWRESGVVTGKQWIASPGACDICEPLDGVVVALDEEFDEGDLPAHPNCECSLLPVLDDADG